MKTNKILATIIVWSLLTAWVTLASSDVESLKSFRWFNSEISQEIKTILEKQKSWTELTQEELELLESKSSMKNKKWWKNKEISNKSSFQWKWIISNLTQEEQLSLESMTEEEKELFFKTKKEALEKQREERELVIDKLLSWISLSSQEEIIRKEIITQRENMKIKKAEQIAKKEEIKTILEKKESGVELTQEEQTILDEFKNIKSRKHK